MKCFVLKLFSKSTDAVTDFYIEGTDIKLIPYYQTGTSESGSITDFNLLKSVKITITKSDC